MNFQLYKKTILERKDKSKAGKIDKAIIKLVDKINKKHNFCTTSSCSGRVMIIAKKQKKDAIWIYSTHDKPKIKDIKESLKEIPKDNVYFKFEPMILHVAAATIEDAQKLVNLARLVGFKRTGLQSTRSKAVIEICSNDMIDTIIAKDGKLLIDDNYLNFLIEEAYSKMDTNKKKIKKLEEKIKNI